MPVAPTVPSPAELQALVDHLAAAISVMDDLRLPVRSLHEELQAFEAGETFEPHHITAEELGILFIAATEAKEAGEQLIKYADELISGLPDLLNRDYGYVAMFAGIELANGEAPAER